MTSQDRHGILLEKVKELATSSRQSENVNAKYLDNGDIRAYRNDERKSGIQELQISSPNNPSNTVTANHSPKIYSVEELSIRKLTPLECWRLQGFTDEQFYKAKNCRLS